MPDAQDVDSLFPAPKAGEPQDVDSLFPQSVETERHASNYGERGSAIQDMIFGDTTRNPIARVLDAFGEGFKQAWGSQPLGLSDQSQKALRDVGLFNDYQKGQTGIVRAGNEALIRPAATALDAVWRASSGAFLGGQAAVAQIGEETGHPLLGREIAALPEAFPFGTAHVIGEAPSILETARSMRIIGKGEAGWKGTAPAEQPITEPPKIEPPPELPTGTSEQPPLAAPASAVPAPVAPVPNVHQVARQDNPDLFARYDPLTEQQTQLRMFIDEGIDTEAARTKLDQIDKDLAELSPQVAQAYRDAADKTSAITIPPAGQFNSMAEMLAAQGKTEPPIEAQRSFIQNDVAQKLIAAGRPAEEAQASGALIAARYETRAARFNGALGTAQELYEREGAEIKGAKPPAAGGTGGVEPTPIQPVPGMGKIDASHDVVSGANSAKEEELFQGPQGKVRITPNRRPIITLAKTADASTFMHESGHVFLEELMRDAAHPQAPGLLRADAETVKQWLGVDSADAIETRHHEKFARGFEQYLREGVAPSASLARVFSQFRDWLLRIYQTIRGLGQPINDDIRGVFDRLLAEKPERTVIAPELAKRPMLADIHEADANLAEPEAAEAMGDRVTAEDSRYGAALPGDIADEHSRGAAEIGAGATERGALPEAGGAPEPVVPSGAGGAPEGTQSSGGGEALSEGAQPRTEQGPAKELGPNDSLPRPEGHFIDKAGNIRLDNLGTPEDVNAVIRQAADQNGDFLSERRHTISDQEALDLSDALGMTPEQLNLRRIGQAYNAEQILAARKLLIQSAGAVRDLAAKAADGTDADVLAYAVAADRHRMIQGQVAGITAEAGRALRAFRSLAGADEARAVGNTIQDITGRTLFQLRATARKIANLDTAEQVSKLVRDSERKGFFDWLQSEFVNALISGPLTHATYTAAGQIYALFRAAGVGGASALVGEVRNAVGFADADRAQFAEIPHQLYGIMRGTRNGVKAAWASLKSNQVVLPPEVQRQMELGGLAQSVGQTVATHETIPNPTVGGVRIPIGTTLEAPSRLVSALHSFNWTTFYSQSISAQTFRQAVKEGLEGDRFSQRVAILTQNPSLEMVEEASKDANAGALMQRPDYDSAMGAISRLTNAGVRVPDIPLPGGRSIPMGTLRPLKYIDPFVQIAGNIMRIGLVRDTPLSIFHQAVRDDLSMKNGGAAFDRAAGRMLAGTGFMLAAGGLASEDILNWSGPSDPKESREWQRVHGLPHGLRIGEMSYDVLRLGPMGMQMSIAADLFHLAGRIGHEDASKVSADLVHAFAQNIVDESFMRGPAEIMQAVDDYDRYGAGWIRNFVSSFVPFSVGLGQVAHVIDPYSRVARTTMDAIKAKIPFVSETLLPRRDIWGEPVPSRGWLGTYRQSIANDPVDQALYPLGIYPALPERRIRGVKLTDQQYDDYSRIAGRDAHMRVNAIVTMPGFSVMPTGPKIELINKAISGSRDRARNLVLMKYPDIIEQAIAAKRAKANPTLH